MMSTPLPRFFTPGDRTRRAHREWLVSGFIELGSVALLIGAEKSGKSALAVELARAVATGDDFLGQSVRQGGVIYIAAERFDETMRRLEVALADFPGVPPVQTTGDVRDLCDCDAVSALLATTAFSRNGSGVATRLIIIDTLHATIGEGDENSSRDIARFRNSLDLLRQRTGAAILLIHHSKRDDRGQASRRARGAQALEAYADVTLVAESRRGERTLVVARGNAVLEGLRLDFALEVIDVGIDPLTGGASSVIVVRSRACAVESSAKRISPDARTALACLDRLCAAGGLVREADWRAETFVAFGERKQGAKREAWRKSRSFLEDLGMIVSAGDCVSVSDPSANRQQLSSADAVGRQRQASAVPPSLRGGADADAQTARAVLSGSPIVSKITDPDEFGDDAAFDFPEHRRAGGAA